MYKDNFYCYSNRKWMKRNTLKKYENEISTFSIMQKKK